MILVFAPHPALERVALVDRFQAGVSQKPMRVSTFAGGAGLRIANAIRLLGGETLALGFVGGPLGALLRDCLDRQDIPHVLTAIAGNTRGDFLVLDKEQGVVTDIPESPPEVTNDERAKLLTALRRHVGNAQLLVLADRDDEADPGLFAEAVAIARDAGVPVIADLWGEALEAAIGAGVLLVRVRLDALQKVTEHSLQHDSAILERSRAMIARGVENVLVTFGEEGALLTMGGGVPSAGAPEGAAAWRIRPPVVSHFNPTGSGEALVGAFAVQYLASGDILEAARYGCAAASVNVTHDEPAHATPGEVAVLFPRTTATQVTAR
jgi:Fructose-1-phosphate kinase and related fructose-6-phosphate kinase (PfkB)